MPFSALVGQDRAVASLKRALSQGRLAHAYLFTGPEGVGKRTTALALAQVVNCQGGTLDGCDACQACRKIRAGLHPDVRVIEPEGTSLKIDQIRELQAEVALKPYEGKRKVFIIDSAERMTEQAGNALLKTLEEPAGETILILVTSNASAVLPTISSRCQEVRFPPIPPGPLAGYLQRERGLDPKQARLLASFSGGSIGQALRIETVSLLTARDRVVEAAFEAIRKGDVAILDFAEASAKERDDLEEAFAHLQGYLRDILVFQLTKREDLLQNGDRGEEIGRWATLLPASVARSLFSAVAAARERVAKNMNPRLVLETMLIEAREVALPYFKGNIDGK